MTLGNEYVNNKQSRCLDWSWWKVDLSDICVGSFWNESNEFICYAHFILSLIIEWWRVHNEIDVASTH